MNRRDEIGPVMTLFVWTFSLAPFVLGAMLGLFVFVKVVKFFWAF